MMIKLSYLTVNDVARRLSVSPSKVYSLIAAGTLPAYRIGSSIRIRPEELTDFIQSNRTGAVRTSPNEKANCRTVLRHLGQRSN